MSARDVNTPNYDIFRNSKKQIKREAFMITYNRQQYCNDYFKYKGYNKFINMNTRSEFTNNFLFELDHIFNNIYNENKNNIHHIDDLYDLYPWFPFNKYLDN